MIRRPPRSTRTDTLFPTRRSSDLDLQPRQACADRRLVERGLAAFLEQCRERSAHFAGQLRHHGHVEQSVVDQRVGAQRLPAAGLAAVADAQRDEVPFRSEEHTSELQSLMRISYAVFCLKKNKQTIQR